MVDELLSRGWVTEVSEPNARRDAPGASGRPAAILCLTDATGYAASIHVGNRTLRVAIGGANGVVRSLASGPSDMDPDRAGLQTLEIAADLLDSSLQDLGVSLSQVRGIALSVPAPVEASTSMLAASSFLRAWANVDLRGELGEALSRQLALAADQVPPIFVGNEVHTSARGLLHPDLDVASLNFVFVKVSKGLGAGLVLDGSVYTGSRGTAAEFGHLPVPGRSSGITCPRCLRVGCLDTVASADAVVARLLAESPDYPSDLQPSDVIKLARRKDPRCHHVLADTGAAIGSALAPMASLLDVDAIIVGGVLADAGDLLLGTMREAIADQAFRFTQPRVWALDRAERRKAAVQGGISQVLQETSPLVAPYT